MDSHVPGTEGQYTRNLRRRRVTAPSPPRKESSGVWMVVYQQRVHPFRQWVVGYTTIQRLAESRVQQWNAETGTREFFYYVKECLPRLI